MENLFNFDQKVALIAGGTGGLGRLIAAELSARGCTVVTCSRGQSNDHQHVVADLRSPEATRDVINTVLAQHGSLDIVVNAMGVVAFGEIVSTSIDAVEELFLTNTFGHIFLMQSALPIMAKGSVLVGISGVIAEQNLPGMAAYGASKAAIVAFGQSIAKALAPMKIGVTTLAPGFVETDMATRLLDGPEGDGIRAQSPFNRVARPEELAKAVYFLASPDSEWASGAVLDFNGASYLRM